MYESENLKENRREKEWNEHRKKVEGGDTIFQK